MLAPQTLSALRLNRMGEHRAVRGINFSEIFFKGTNESQCFKNSSDCTSIAHVLQGIQHKHVSLSLPSRGRRALTDVDAQAQGGPRIHSRLSKQEVREVENPGVCQHTHVHAYWYFTDWMASTSKGLTINFPFINSLETTELQAWTGNS